MRVSNLRVPYSRHVPALPFGIIVLLAGCGGNSTSGNQSNNPMPAISSLSPSSLPIGSAAQALTINGSGFVSSSTVTFNGVSRAATYLSSSQLTIGLTSADLSTAGNYPVAVSNPGPGGGNSAAVNFKVTVVAVHQEWAWMGGSDTIPTSCRFGNCGQSGDYGTPGVPAAGNVPGGRYSSVSWTDLIGNLWLFGGEGFDANGDLFPLNDLWRYEPASGEWTWMSGSDLVGQRGVYGTLGVSAASNVPGARINAVSWTDASGGLWLFGGQGYDANGQFEILNDLWKYTPSTGEWAWMGGSNSAGQPGVYGTLGVPAAENLPGARWGAVGWTDASGNLWLFGGEGCSADSCGDDDTLNDLWEYTPSTGQWTWVSGSNTGADNPGVYGTLGEPAADNVPGTRGSAVSWTDASGSLWLFGGAGYGSTASLFGSLNDLWKYTPSTGEWTWISGSNTVGQPGVYGTQGVPAPDNVPGARDSAASWTDASGSFWLFGGEGYGASGLYASELNDLWKFALSTGEWTWMGGSSAEEQPGVYGTQSVPAAGNVPGARSSGVSWSGASDNFWLFGGGGYDADGYLGQLNDLWVYQP